MERQGRKALERLVETARRLMTLLWPLWIAYLLWIAARSLVMFKDRYPRVESILDKVLPWIS